MVQRNSLYDLLTPNWGFCYYKHSTMTNTELNKHVRNMAKRIESKALDPYSTEACSLFDRLHGADPSFKSFTADSLRILIVLNRRYHYVNFQDFGPADYE